MDDSHTVRFAHYVSQDGWDDEIYISSYLSTEVSFFKRVWYGIRYIFGYKSKYGDFGDTMLNTQQIAHLRNYLTDYLKETSDV